MNDLTKEDCMYAFKKINEHFDNEYDEHDEKLSCYYSWHLCTLQDLINAHFDNPPLTFKNFEKGLFNIGDPIFHKDEKNWYLLIAIVPVMHGKKHVCDIVHVRDLSGENNEFINNGDDFYLREVV